MKIVTIGLSPFLLTSRSKIHASILKHLYLNGYSVAAAVWGHDINYFVPEEENGKKQCYYDFKYNGITHKIPLAPFSRKTQESVAVYEILMSLKPDIVITVGDIADFTYMHAVKMFYTKEIKWFAILMSYGVPINENNFELLGDVDGILCTSQSCYQSVESLCKCEIIDTCYIGYDIENQPNIDRDDSFRLMASLKKSQSDNAPMIMQAVVELKKDIPEIELYLHANVQDPGDYDLDLLKDRFDPDAKVISFPSKSVSLLEGFSEQEVNAELMKSPVFISIPMVSATSMGVFQALACGCYPILSNSGSNKDIIHILCKYLEGFTEKDFLIPGIELMTVGETYLYVCSRESLKEKILHAHKNMKKYKGLREQVMQFILHYSHERFLKRVSDMAMLVKESKTVACLEHV